MNAQTMLAQRSDLARFDAAKVAAMDWRQPQWSRKYWELYAGGSVVATLAWRGPWRRGYDARTSNGEWSIRESLWGRRSIHRGDEEAPVATTARPHAGVRSRRRRDRAGGCRAPAPRC